MYPSPGERFHIDQQRQQQEAWAWQEAEAARLNAMLSAQIAGRASQAEQMIATEQGTSMYYEERAFDVGDVQIGAGLDNRPAIQVPGEFGTALSFVATVSNDGWESAGEYLWCSFHTSVDGHNWIAINAPGQSAYAAAQAGRSASMRQHGPFGDRLALKVGFKKRNTLDDYEWLPGKCRGLRLTIGVQRI